MALYHSTRSLSGDLYPAKHAILHGIADDGGLYITDDLDEISLNVNDMCNKNFLEIAQTILKAFLSDYSDEEIAACVHNAYDASFDSPELTPLVCVGKRHILELFHGPTSAFKDVALQILPHLMGYAASSNDKKIMVLTATSGDTGKAALEGFADVENVGISVFYPHNGTSEIQRLQMATQKGNNVFVWAVEGNFDDTQTHVKQIFANTSLAHALNQENVILSSANSINIGRLIPQVTYYFYAYAQLVQSKRITLGDKIDFCVPTGNFGNVLAGWLAKQLGLPVHKFIVASNENNILTDFLTTGVYDKNRPFYKTISPSMDILISSNLERLLYYASGNDAAYVAKLMDDLAKTGRYEVQGNILARIQNDFECGFATDNQAREAIEACYKTHGYILDTHTAVAWHVLQNCGPSQAKAQVVLATASPYKFCKDVCNALHIPLDANASDFDALRALQTQSNTQAPVRLARLENLPVRFNDVITADDMTNVVEHSCKEIAQ
ncbi:MAG: threonine synthase [Eggerthellaceae bacterium]|nr:threonine synthase [Eggerthellaceae bacterium]